MYVTPKRCPRCRYERKATDTAPDWQCPSCGVAYNKVEGGPLPHPTATRNTQPSSSGAWKTGLVVAATVLAAYGIYVFQHGVPHRAPVAQASGAQPQVVMYATSWCGYCAKARAYFAQNKIDYVELDVDRDAEAAQINRRLGGGGVPTIMVGDTLVNGFNEQALTEALGPWLK
jgi:glutaredoxin